MGAIIWLASYPKSGNTWLRAFLHNLLRNPQEGYDINRLDDVIMFQSLGKEQIERIVDLQLKQVVDRLEKRELGLDVSKVAKQKLAEDGFDPLYGARPLKRLIQREVVDKIAKAVLEGRFNRGDVVKVELDLQLIAPQA